MNEMLLIVGLVLGIGGDIFWAYVVNWPKRKGKIPVSIHAFNYHFHHSVLGLIFVIVGLLINVVILTGFGLGIIVSHTLRTKEFVFIHKVKGGRK